MSSSRSLTFGTKHLRLFLLFLAGTMLGTPSHADDCRDFLLRPILSFRNDNLGMGARRILRSKDTLDLILIQASYLKSVSQGPIEMGSVELLDSSGKALALRVLEGKYGTMGASMNQRIVDFLNENPAAVSIAESLQIRHTHPTEFSSSQVTAIKHRFSRGDKTEDLKLRQFLSSSPEYQNLSLRSWIIYITDEPSTYFGSRVELQDLRIRGYELLK